MKNGGTKNITFIAVALLLSLVMIIGFRQGIASSNSSNYMGKYKSLDELKSSMTFEIIYPTFMYDEKDLRISDIMGQIVEVRNSNFVFKASAFIDVNADVLGIYDKLLEDTLYEVKENTEESSKGSESSGVTYFRYRCSGKQTLINWVRNETAYGLILDRVADIEDAKNIVGISNCKLTEYTGNENTTVEKLVDYEYIEEANIKFKIPSDIELVDERVLNEAVIYLVDDKPVLIVAYNNLNKYKELYGADTKIKELNNAIIMYKTVDMLSEEDKSIENYYKFIVTVDELLESIENIEEN